MLTLKVLHRQIIKTVNTGNFLDEIGSAINITAPRWRTDLPTILFTKNIKPELLQNFGLTRNFQLHAGQLSQRFMAKENISLPVNTVASNNNLAGLATAYIKNHPRDVTGRPFGRGHIKPTLKTIARI